MKVQIMQPGFEPPQRNPRYFIRRIGGDEPEFDDGFRFEIQLCNDSLQAGAVILLTGEETEYDVPEFEIAPAVFREALSLLPGEDGFVDANGERVARPW